MIKKPLLTIAIPTYNRANYLDECLKSIIDQIDESNTEFIEVFISNNCSTDETKKVIEKYFNRCNITYYENEKNFGPDINIYNCIYKSSGKFVHLISDDDIVLPNTINNLVKFLLNNPDISLVHLNSCWFIGDFNQLEISEQRMKISRDIITNDKNKFMECLGIFITFLSSTVLNREKLYKIDNPNKYFNTYFFQSHVALNITKGNEKMGIIAHNSIAARGENSGGYNLYKVWIYQYKKLLLETGVENGYDRKLMNLIYKNSLCKEVRGYIISAIHRNTRFDLEDYKLFFKSTYMYPSVWFKVYPYAFLPISIYKHLKKIKTIFNNSNGGI